MTRRRMLSAVVGGLLLLSAAGCSANEQTAEKGTNTLSHFSISTNSETAHNTLSGETSSSASMPVQEQQTTSQQAYSSTADRETQTPAKQPSASEPPVLQKPQETSQSERNPASSAQAASTPINESESAHPSVSQQTETSKMPELPEPEASKPAEPEPQFDINFWIDFAKQCAEDLGFRLNSEAVECWDNPIGAHAKCKYLERDIKSRLSMYARYGDITEIWVWAEEVAPQSYELYIGYA